MLAGVVFEALDIIKGQETLSDFEQQVTALVLIFLCIRFLSTRHFKAAPWEQPAVSLHALQYPHVQFSNRPSLLASHPLLLCGKTPHRSSMPCCFSASMASIASQCSMGPMVCLAIVIVFSQSRRHCEHDQSKRGCRCAFALYAS